MNIPRAASAEHISSSNKDYKHEFPIDTPSHRLRNIWCQYDVKRKDTRNSLQKLLTPVFSHEFKNWHLKWENGL